MNSVRRRFVVIALSSIETEIKKVQNSKLGPSLNRWMLVSIPLISLALAARIGMIAWPFLNDSGLYAAMGRTVAIGGVLYRDFYETKLPGAGLLTGAFWFAFGSHWAGYVLCQLAMTLAAAIALSRLSKPMPTFLFAIVFLNLSQLVYTGFQLETIQAFFEALAALAAFKSINEDNLQATFWAGVFASMAAMAKPGGLGIAIALLICLGRRRWMHTLRLLMGVAIPLAVTLLYTVRSGAWPYLPQVIADIRSYATGTPMGWDSVWKVLIVLSVFAFPFAVRLRSKHTAIGGTPMLFVGIWFLTDLLAAVMQRRLYPYHFLPLACPAAVLYGMMPRRATPLAVIAGLLPIALLSLTWEGSSLSKIHRGFEHMPVSDYIIAHTDSTDSVFADQIGRLLIETNRKPGSRLGTFFYFVNDDNAPQHYCQILLSDFEARKPKYLVLAKGWDQKEPGLANCDILQRCPQRRVNFIAAWAVLRDYVASHYHQETTLDGMMIYRRSSVEH